METLLFLLPQALESYQEKVGGDSVKAKATARAKAGEEKSKVRRIPAIVLERFASEGAIGRTFRGGELERSVKWNEDDGARTERTELSLFYLFLLFPGVGFCGRHTPWKSERASEA
jgi:hypothetical protein